MARVALVTGGTRGIGYAIVKRLKDDGCLVAAGYSGNDEAAARCAEELGVMVVKGNVGHFDDCARAVREVEATLGPVDILVNNAGITRDGVFHKMTPDQWGEVVSVNMNSAFNMTRQVIEGMRDRSWGRIINISSINGQKGQMGQTNYSAAKAGLIGFTKALAQESAKRGITVAGLYRHRDGQGGAGTGPGLDRRGDPGRPTRPGRRDRRRRGFPGARGRRLHHRGHPDHERGPIYCRLILRACPNLVLSPS